MGFPSGSVETGEEVLAASDIRLGGERPWDVRIGDKRCLSMLLRLGSFGLGETYVEGWWESPRPDELLYRYLSGPVAQRRRKTPRVIWKIVKSHLVNQHKARRAFVIGERHYDLGNDLFRNMLDSWMTYSCGYWKHASTLEDAQAAKLDLVCRKLGLRRGLRVLDIGCGWGSLCRYASEKYGVEITGITVSREQADLARERCTGLPVTILLQDYRSLQGVFDRIVSIGMIEHVGSGNYRSYFRKVNRCLSEDGLFLLQTITGDTFSRTSKIGVDQLALWIERHVFPHGEVPAITKLRRAVAGLLVAEDWQSFGADYDKTLMAWYRNFSERWSELQDRYDERFRRMWTFYLLSCAAAFRTRDVDLWQGVFSKRGVPGGYVSVR